MSETLQWIITIAILVGVSARIIDGILRGKKSKKGCYGCKMSECCKNKSKKCCDNLHSK